MRSVWKYNIVVNDAVQVVETPQGATLLKVAAQQPLQADSIQLWFEVDPEKSGTTDKHMYAVYGTGHPIGLTAEDAKYVDSVIVAGGVLVWHVYEIDPIK